MENEGVVEVCVTGDRGDGSDVFNITLLTSNITTQGTHKRWQQILL